MLEVYSLLYLRQQVNGLVRLMVEDEGKGFEPVELNEWTAVGLGLPSTREQVELVGGRLKIELEPGEGTRATITVPV